MANLTGQQPYKKASPQDKKRDEQFRAWVRTQPSCISGKFSEFVNGKWLNPACHVLRVSRGSGKADKPLFSCIPLTHEEHHLAHQHGFTYILPEEVLIASPCNFAKEWEEWQADNYFRRWMQLDH